MNFYFLHGFLGLPSDFEPTMRFMEIPDENSKVLSVDYLRFRETSSLVPLTEWGGRFNRWVQGYERSHGAASRILVGYSQGGRLALQACRAQPSFWQGLVLISTNPGISQGEKSTRLKMDQEWAERFQNENFTKTLEKWNAQAVFRGSVAEPQRKESDFNRHLLSGCLINWSVAHQDDFFPEIRNFPMPVLYVAGEKDQKYVQIGKKLKSLKPAIDLAVVPQAAHRVPMDAPEALAQAISRWVGGLP